MGGDRRGVHTGQRQRGENIALMFSVLLGEECFQLFCCDRRAGRRRVYPFKKKRLQCSTCAKE